MPVVKGGESLSLGTKIVIFHQNGIAIPPGSGVFEIANQFLLLRIHTDDGQALGGELFPLPADVKELLIAVRAFGGGNLFAVHAKFEVHLFQQTAYGVLAHLDPQAGELFGDVARCSPAPLEPGNGVAGSIVPDQFFDSGDDFGCFFSTRLRPPPAWRMRSVPKSCSMSSRRPLATVWGSMPMNSAIR